MALSLPEVPALSELASRLDFTRFLSQAQRLLQIETALPSTALVAERLTGREALSEPFRFTVDCLANNAHFELKALIGEEVTLRLLQADGSYRPWHGFVRSCAALGADGGLARYRLELGSWLDMLALRRDSYVFQDKTAVEIAEEVFADYPQANFRLDVTEPLRKRSLCIQYRETDLEFVSRLLAEEGLTYRFEHLDGEEAAKANVQAKHRLVVSDRNASRTALGDIRFTRQDGTEKADSITAFGSQRQLQANAVGVGSWDYKRLAGVAASEESALGQGEVPALEIYDGSDAYRYENPAHAERAAQLRLQALELDLKGFEGHGAVRRFLAGLEFSLIDHPLYGANTTSMNYAGAATASHQRPDNAFVILAVEHTATNNLGAQAAELLEATDLEHGTYRNRFICAPAAAPVVPRFVKKPTALGSQPALVVGLPDEVLSTERDLRVKIQFPWQRGQKPLSGGLTETGSPTDKKGNAPGNDQSGTWVRVAQSIAGPNWGMAFVPRIQTEVAVEFIEGDIDRPIVVGQLYNGADAPPFAAGIDSGINHPGVLSGIHSHSLDGQGLNQWVLDDATSQLRMRFLADNRGLTAQLNLGYLIQQGRQGAQRGGYRGQGFELATDGWAMLRAKQGMVFTTTARAHGASTQLDVAESVAQLKSARMLGERLEQSAQQAKALGLNSLKPKEALDKLEEMLDVERRGKFTAAVNGHEAKKAQPGSRTLADPVERPDQAIVLLDTPTTALFATQAAMAVSAGRDVAWTAQGDLSLTAAHTYAAVSGKATSLYSYEGGIKAYAANGPVSIRAHTDQLEVLADESITVMSVNDEIHVNARSKITLLGGQSTVTLEGGDITFACPGTFAVKMSTHAWEGPGNGVANLGALPDSRLKIFDEQFRAVNRQTGEPMAGIPYHIRLSDGSVLSGTTDDLGRTQRVSTADPEALTLYWGQLDAENELPDGSNDTIC
jgi:type VI secretion system secreted protein VgrG